MRALASAFLILSTVVWPQLAAGQPSTSSWTLTTLKAQMVPAIWVLDGNEYVRESPPQGENFLEIQGRLTVPPGALLDPMALSEIRVRNTRSAAIAKPQSPFVVGLSILTCRYFPPETRAHDLSRRIVGHDGSLGLSRDSANAPLTLAIEGSHVDLCMAFAGSGRMGSSVSLEFAGHSFTIPLTPMERPRQAAKATADPPTRPYWDGLLSSRATLIAGLCLLILGLGTLAIWRWRTHRAFLPARHAKSPDDPDVATAEGDASRSPGYELVEPERVSSEHCRTSFVRVGTSAGPGKADFEAALRALQGERFSDADTLLEQAITKGLMATFECGAWSMRGQAAAAIGEIPRAISYFLKALGGPEVTAQAALPAAMHLAVIYRELGLRADAVKMEAVATTLKSVNITLDPEVNRRIKQSTQAYRRALRATHPTGLKALATRLLHRPRSTSAT